LLQFACQPVPSTTAAVTALSAASLERHVSILRILAWCALAALQVHQRGLGVS
jgi:hypothetical protein